MVSQVMTNDEFEALLSKYDYKFQKGDLVKGTVCGYDSDGAIVEIGSKSAASVSEREVTLNEGEKLQDVLVKGETYEFLILREQDDEDGKYILSRKKVEQAYVWKELEQIKEKDEVIVASVISKTKGGLIVDVQGLKGFVPMSQLSIREEEYKAGEKLELRILTLDAQQNNFVLSNKKAINDTDEETKQNLFSQIEVGQILKGEVVRIADFGAFVDLGGIDGLLPLSQMSWKWVEHPKDVVKLREKIEVEVIGIDNDKQRVSLSLKSLQPDPWVEAEKVIQEGSVREGVITRLKNFGAFVEVFDGVEALLPEEEVLQYQNSHNVILKVGDRIETCVTKFNPADKRISLSVKVKTPATV